MKTFFILAFVLYFFSTANAQQTIDKLNTNQLKLPKESVNKALILDGAGQVKSSSTITDTELGYLEGLTDTLVNLLSGKANDGDVVKLTGNQSVDGIKTFTGKLVASSTVNGSIPCPVMTEAQRDLFTPVEGDCVYNSDTLKLNVFDGSVWKDVGGAGGISLWLTANPYNVNDIVIESDKIYRCLIAHTSGTFATDLAASKWGEVSSGLQSPVSLADGGTGVAITPTAGSIVYVDADSFEQVSGTAGQVLQSNGSGAPTFVNKSISAKSQNNASVTAEEIQVPNNLLTQTDTNKHLNETGNKNILANPSFEHSTFSTSWTNSAGTFTQELTSVIDGKASAKLVLSSQTMSLTQSSTLYQAQFADGVQGLASVRVKSDVALKVCSIQAGTVSTSNCVDVQANNKWGLYKVPMILGATSNGISIASTGAVTGTIYIDDAFVGAASLTQEMNACNDVSCETEFSAKISSTGVVSGENLDWINVNCTSSSGTYVCTYQTSVFTVAPNCSILPNAVSGSSGTYASIVSATSSSITLFQTSGQGFQIVCQKSGADFTAAKQLSNGNTYSSTNADTDWASCTPTSSQGFGTPTFAVQCKRQGGDLLMKGNFTPSGTTAVEARIGLPLWNGSQLISAGSSIIPSLQTNGIYFRNIASVDGRGGSILIEPSVAYFTFGNSGTFGTSSVNPLTKANANQITSAEFLSFNARIPIEGWQQSNIIIGQFNGLESCTDTLSCTDTFSALGSSTAVLSQENVDWINGNGSVASGLYTYTFKTGVFTVAPNCSVSVGPFGTSVGNYLATINTITSSSISFNAIISGTTTAFPHQIICQKQGADYIGKTAKAVASDQSVRSIGSTGMDIQSVHFAGATISTTCTTSPCVIHNSVGSKITSVTRTGPGDYNINGIDGIKYICTGGANASSYVGFSHRRDLSSSSFARVQFGSGPTPLDVNNSSISCLGIP
jgi:hypothetical protein